MSRLRTTGVVLGLAICQACSHPLEVTRHPDTDQPWQAVGGPITIGFAATDELMLEAVIDEISRDSRVAAVRTDYTIGDGEVDYVVDLRQHMDHGADAQNFWITIPGFIVFTHAWLGYMYTVDVHTTSVLMDADGNRLSEVNLTAPYEVRHTSFRRGATTSLVGWFLPPYGLLAAIPGAVFAQKYDLQATEPFELEALPSYRPIVAAAVLEQIAAVDPGASITTTGQASSRRPAEDAFAAEVSVDVVLPHRAPEADEPHGELRMPAPPEEAVAQGIGPVRLATVDGTPASVETDLALRLTPGPHELGFVRPGNDETAVPVVIHVREGATYWVGSRRTAAGWEPVVYAVRERHTDRTAATD